VSSDLNTELIIDLSNNDGHGKRHHHSVRTRLVCMSALTDAKVQNIPVSSSTQASPTLLDVLSRLECELNQFQSAIQTPKARAAALATADRGIDDAQRLMLSMLTRRNTLVPISILPADVLSRIFHFIAFEELSDLFDCVFAHVCRRWRQVALDDSTLWTHFSDLPRNKDWIAERLFRARHAPLVIHLYQSMGKDTLSLFTPHITHTRELDLSGLSRHSKIVQEISIQKAPILEYLKFGELDSLPMDNGHVGHLFFKGTLPKLRMLEVSTVFPWSLFPRGQLTELTVTLIGGVSALTSKDSQHDGLNQFIGLLVASPSLEVLTLQNCLPTTLSSESLDGQPIHLPRLSRLCLTGSSPCVTNLFKMLKLSSSTRLRLNCTSENTATPNGYHILPILSEHFNDPTHVKFRNFKIDVDHTHGMIEMIASTSLPMSPIPRTHFIQADGDPELSLSFHRISDLNRLSDILRKACNVLSLSNIEFFSFSSRIPNQVIIDWSDIFQHCPEVATVQVDGGRTIGLLQALTSPKRANDNGRGAEAQAANDNDNHAPAPMHVPIFPKLTSLRLKTLNFTYSGVLSDLVINAVQQRKVNKTPLTTLCIEKCVIREKQAAALEKLVCDFQWDHYKGYYDDEESNREDSEFDDDGDDHSDMSDW